MTMILVALVVLVLVAASVQNAAERRDTERRIQSSQDAIRRSREFWTARGW